MKSINFFLTGILMIALCFFTSCDHILFLKKKDIQPLDTIVDVTTVDLYPSFPVCDSLVDKAKKADCFRITIHQKIREELLQHNFDAKDSINETILVDILVNANGEIVFESLQTSEAVEEQLPELDSLIRVSIENLPKIIAANKRGIPVTTKYQLPIKIKVGD